MAMFALQLQKKVKGGYSVRPPAMQQAYIRIYAASDEDLAKGMKRMTKYIERYAAKDELKRLLVRKNYHN